MVKIFSPTATETFGRCETYWALQREGWRLDYFGYPNVAAAVGTGVHYGAAQVHEAVQIGMPKTRMDTLWQRKVEDYAVREACVQLENLVEKGVYPIEKVEDWRERVSDQVERGTKAYINQFSDWFNPDDKIIALEESYGYDRGDLGYMGRFDLLFQGDSGFTLVDIKTKQPFKSDYYRTMFVGQFQYSWQMYSYAHMIKLRSGELPNRLALVMMEMKAKPVVTFHPFRFDEVYYRRWLMSARRRWLRMEAIEGGDVVPSIADQHMFYGQQCPYKKACLDYGCDEQAMLNDGYVNILEDDKA